MGFCLLPIDTLVRLYYYAGCRAYTAFLKGESDG